ncbi:hypothetical protein B0A80_00585 [Flavobacterium tructae]|nr:hypothetical protein B0A80_00585 [Flavobacterium tructae]
MPQIRMISKILKNNLPDQPNLREYFFATNSRILMPQIRMISKILKSNLPDQPNLREYFFCHEFTNFIAID